MLTSVVIRTHFLFFFKAKRAWLVFSTLAGLSVSGSAIAQQNLTLVVNWHKTTLVSRSTPTLQVVVNPPLRPGQPLGKAAFNALKLLGANDVRFVPWLPYPRLGVAELKPPTDKKTFWDFNLIDPITTAFLNSTKGHPVVMNFSTMPAWLFKTPSPVTYPKDPNQPYWNYTQGTVLNDPSGKQLGDYYRRLASWYVDGGFVDEDGVRHNSGYHYKIAIWEVLNEVEAEHSTSPQDYTKRYDAIVAGIHKASPTTQFMGMALAFPGNDMDFIKYFLNPANHKPGIPINYISYHFYASPGPNQTLAQWPATFFAQAKGFLGTVGKIQAVREELSPKTKTDIDELGVILPTDNGPKDSIPPPHAYWNLAGSLFAYLYVELSKLKVDIVGESQLVGYPTQYPSVSMMDWTTNKPNARFWVLKLLKDNFHPGDHLVDTQVSGEGSDQVEVQAYHTRSGNKILLINKSASPIYIGIPNSKGASALSVDEKTGDNPARRIGIKDGAIKLNPFAVTVVSWRR